MAMKAKLLMTVEQAEKDPKAWEKLRGAGIGGSDVACIMGLNPWKSAYALYCEKTGIVEPEDLSDKEAVIFGTKLEGIVAERFTELTGKKLKRCGTVCDPSDEWMLGNFDRLIVGEECGLECKTANAFKKEEWEGDNVPDAYYCQCQWYMALSGFSSWWIACLLGGQHFEYKLIPRNNDFINDMVAKVSTFWNYNVLQKVPPEVDGSESTSDTLKKVYPTSEATTIDLPSKTADVLARYDELKKTEAILKEEKAQCENELKLMLGDNEIGLWDDRKISWKTQKGRVTVDTKKLQKLFPDAYNACMKVGEATRVLRVK